MRIPLLVLATLTAAGAAAAAGYALTAPDRYRATAQLLVSPVAESETGFTGIDVLRDTGGRRTAAESAAALVKTPLVADAVRALLGLKRSRDSLLDAIDVEVVGKGNVVAVTAEDTSANGSAQLANAFVDTVINQRSATFQSEVASAVRRYEQQLASLSRAERAGPLGTELGKRLAVLRPLQGQPDPSLSHAGQAAAPTSAAWPDVGKLVLIGAGIGALVGLIAAIAVAVYRRRGAQYDRSMPERSADELVERLESRLVAREQALAARERDVQAALNELRAAQASSSAGGDLAQRERELDDRERELEAREAETRDTSDLERREHALEERVAAVTKREVELAKRAATLVVRERELEEIEQAPEPVPEPQPAPQARIVPAVAGAAGGYNLVTLERLVEERRAEHPERAEEWESYLFFLRDYAAPDGAVPATFDWLIQEQFAEVL